jgi:hypothetical protein
MDTRYWGPSGWQLFHLIAFRSPHPDELLLMIKDVLPCRFCRESTRQYTHDLPLKGDSGKWLYDLHNKVNHKLRVQAKEDPSVIDPGPDPSFEEVKSRYLAMTPTSVPGRDFLFSVAANYPTSPTEDDMALQRRFMKVLSDVYPFEDMRAVFKTYLATNPVALKNQIAYMKWVYGLLMTLSKKIKVPIRTYKGYVQHTMYYKSGCAKKTYRGVTCRKQSGGGRTKLRDHIKTRKVAHKNLL